MWAEGVGGWIIGMLIVGAPGSRSARWWSGTRGPSTASGATEPLQRFCVCEAVDVSKPMIALSEVAALQSPPVNPIAVLRRGRKDPAFPAPEKIAGRWFFDADAYEAYERRRQREAIA